MSAEGGSTPWARGQGVPERRERQERTRHLIRRSILVVPANVPAFVGKAHLRGADAIMLDLEDSVPEREKGDARNSAAAAIDVVGRGGADVLVRINGSFETAVRDLDAVIRPGLCCVWFPKAESASQMVVLDALITEREIAAGLPVGQIELAVSLETAAGILAASSILQASSRIVTATFGSEDIALDLGVEPSTEGTERRWGNGLVVLAAVASGVQPIGRLGNVANYSDIDGWEATVKQASEFGFKGSSCIHPSQVAALNTYFSPAPTLVEWAKRVVATLDEAQSQGRASASLDGRMIDIPTHERARRLLERAAAIERKDRDKEARLGAFRELPSEP